MLLPKQKKKNPFSKLLNFFNDPSVGEPAEGSLPSEGPLGPTSHPCLFTLLLRRARLNWPPGGLHPRARARRRHPELCLKNAV